MKNFKKMLSVMFLSVLSILICFGYNEKTYAATTVTGTDLASSQQVTFGETYSMYWDKSNKTDGNIYYFKVSLEEQGILTMNFTKPVDKRGEYEELIVTVYDESGDDVEFVTYSYEVTKETSDNMSFNVGLDKGNHYILVRLQSSIYLDSASSDLTVSFEENEYCEIESNGSYATANTLELGNEYVGYYGYDSLYKGDYGNYDYWKVNLKAGFTYKITLDGDTKVIFDNSRTILINIIDKDGKNKGFISSGAKRQLDGTYSAYYTPKTTGEHYIQVYNYKKKQFKYIIGMDVEQKSLKNCTLSLNKSSYNYTGKEVKPKLAVKNGDITLKEGVDYTVSCKNNKNIGKATVTITGIGNYKDSITKKFEIKAKKGSTFEAGAYEYKVTNASTVAFNGIVSSKTKNVVVPKTVKYGGKTFKVTSIASKALKGETKIISISVGANVKTIGASAFEKCKKLKTITIKSTKLKSVGKKAFKGISSKATIKVPKNKLTTYKKLFKGKGQGSKVKIKK